MKGKRVFVSGAAGVIGREMIPRLVARGAIVLAADLKPRPEGFPTQVQYRMGDLNCMTQIEWDTFAPEIFIHLAATFERSEESYGFWEENFLHNVQLSHHLMSLARNAMDLKKVVFASSYLIYAPELYQFDSPKDHAISLKETDPVYPRNLTGMAKFAHEIELRFIDTFCGDRLSTVCARIYRGYGRNSRDVISRWARDLLQGKPITVYRPEGRFDYIYAADTAEGLIRLAGHPTASGIINLGTGKARGVSDVVNVFRKYFPEMQANMEESDIPYEASQADISKYTSLIGWHPEYDIEKAIPEIIEYERNQSGRTSSPHLRFKALISSAAAKVPLVRAMQAAVRQFGPDGEVVAGDLDPRAVSAYVANAFWQMPPTRKENFAQIMEELRNRNINCVLPTRDGELLFWAQHKDELAQAGIQVIVSPPDSIALCLDKLAFAHYGQQRGFSFIPATDNLDELTADTLVVKERYGAGSRSLGLNLTREEARRHATELEAPIFQPMVHGIEISIDAWLDRTHKVKGLVLRRRDQVVNGESRVTTVFSDAVIEASARVILESLKLSGPVVMQAFLDEAGGLQVIECNPRFGGASTAGMAAGLDGLHWSLLEIAGADLGDWPFHRRPGSFRQVRVAQDLYVADSDL